MTKVLACSLQTTTKSRILSYLWPLSKVSEQVAFPKKVCVDTHWSQSTPGLALSSSPISERTLPALLR